MLDLETTGQPSDGTGITEIGVVKVRGGEQAALARRALIRDEVPNHQLATLARYFRTQASPTPRALDDARATVEVLHAAQRVEAVVCAHRLEAEVRELRLIAAHQPPAVARELPGADHALIPGQGHRPVL